MTLSLVSAPEPARRCGGCTRALTAIELRCDCPQMLLARGLFQLRIAFRQSVTRNKRKAQNAR